MRTLTLGDLLTEVRRRATDPLAAVITIDGEPVQLDSTEYEIEHRPGGVTVTFKTSCDGEC